MKPKPLALIEAASFCAVPIAIGRHKRYSGEQEQLLNSILKF
jgi:hypothetical protein